MQFILQKPVLEVILGDLFVRINTEVILMEVMINATNDYLHDIKMTALDILPNIFEDLQSNHSPLTSLDHEERL